MAANIASKRKWFDVQIYVIYGVKGFRDFRDVAILIKEMFMHLFVWYASVTL